MLDWKESQIFFVAGQKYRNALEEELQYVQ